MTRNLNGTIGLLLCLATVREAQAATRYAKVSATGLGDCTSWADACSLGGAILAAQLGDDVWVQAGVYPPFALKDAVRIMGGFAGTETLASQSNPATNVTVVDAGGSQRCVTSYDTGPGTVLRGFKIVNGYDGDDRGRGALLLNNSSPVIVDCIFEHSSTDCDQNGVADACEIEAYPRLDCRNHNGYLGLCESTAVVPRDACCNEEACEWPTTSCRCAANGGFWHRNMTCDQVTCHLLEADY